MCLFSKAIYGCKQSPRAWFHHLSSVLAIHGFQASSSDPSLFNGHFNGDTTIFSVYVDDILVTDSNPSYIHDLASALTFHFPLKDLGHLHHFIGIYALHTPYGLHLSQAQYVKDILSCAKMLQAKPCSSPILANNPFSLHLGDPLSNPHLYKCIVGALQYATITRPVISFAVNKVSQLMHAPTSSH